MTRSRSSAATPPSCSRSSEDVMDEMKAVDLGQVMNTIRSSGRPNTVLWQAPDSIAFVARGREFRSEFHSDPSDEVMYMIKGDMNLHYRTPEGEEKVAVIKEGQIVHCPAGTPHSPRFSPDAFVLVLERKRRAGEDDRFTWFCEQCGAQLHQSVKHVADYREDPVSRAYEEFYGSEQHRTCDRRHDGRAASDRALRRDGRLEARADDRFVDEALPDAQKTAGVQHCQARARSSAARAAIDAAGRDHDRVAAHGARPLERHRELGERHALDVGVRRVTRGQRLGDGGEKAIAEHDQLAGGARLHSEAEPRGVHDREEGPAIGDVHGDAAEALH